MSKFLREWKRCFVYTSAFVISLFIIGCTPKTGNYGAPIQTKQATPISAILADANGYKGQTVLIEGEITLECPSGCWFDVSDKTGSIYVDIASGGGFSIPQHTGRQVRVEGQVDVRENGNPLIHGTGVEIL